MNRNRILHRHPAPLKPGRVLAACLAASFFLCSCATPYQPLDHRYGYSEQQVGKDVYEVTFLGNADTSYERAFDFAMLRAADIALSRRAKSFALLDLTNLSFVRTYKTPTLYYWTPSHAAGPADWTARDSLVMEPAQERTYYRPGVKLKVKLLSDPPGSYYPYDPAKESERLKRKYRIKMRSRPPQSP